MERFSVTEIALTGFRIVKERPKVVLFWGAAQLLFSLCLILLMVASVGPALTQMSATGFAPSQHADPAQTLAQFQKILPMYFVFGVLGAVFYPILYGAMNRAVLRPDESRFGYLRVGPDELRQFGLFLLMFILGLLAYLALFIVAGLVIALIAGLSGLALSHVNPMLAGVVTGLGTVAVMGVAFCAWIFLCVRFSLASPQTFATRKINLFGSWSLTRTAFWPALGTYVVAFALLMGVSILYFAILLPLDVAIGGGLAGLNTAFHPDMNSFATYFSPVIVLNLLVGAILSALMWPILLTPPAAIYEKLTMEAAPSVFS
ncbi:MAG: hypothetical protein WA840_20295 [Caulobacteraceae bacterium]